MLTHDASTFDRTPHALVPTMGALHEGHLALIRRAAQLAEQHNLAHVAVSIFVNPTQFNEPADYDRYPRTLQDDAQKATDAGATIIWAPTPETVYPKDQPIPVGPLPPVATQPKLEDASRPGHFEGVAQVVRRLFHLTRPTVALFGEKDWQQLQVIRAMVQSEAIPVTIESIPIIRDRDGLAKASRNVFLTPDQRRAALAIPQALTLANQHPTPQAAERAMRDHIQAAGLQAEYAAIRHPQTLLPLTKPPPPPAPSPPRGEGRGEGLPKQSASPSSPLPNPPRALIAARTGQTRLLDNAPWTPNNQPT